MQLKKIGTIESPFTSLDECPSNVSTAGPICKLNLEPEFAPGLKGLKVGQNILVLYWFDKADRTPLVQSNVHKKDGENTGTFALRSPNRPNPIAASVLPIQSIDDNVVTVKGLDCLNGTPLLDIKPN